MLALVAESAGRPAVAEQWERGRPNHLLKRFVADSPIPAASNVPPGKLQNRTRPHGNTRGRKQRDTN